MHRNLDRRVEVLVSITNQRHVAEIEQMFATCFDEGTVSCQLVDTTWTPHTTDSYGQPLMDLQEDEIQQTKLRRH